MLALCLGKAVLRRRKKKLLQIYIYIYVGTKQFSVSLSPSSPRAFPAFAKHSLNLCDGGIHSYIAFTCTIFGSR